MDNQKELKPCPFCGGSGVENFCCGAAIPDCPRCSPLFGCGACDVWLDSVEEWNTRAESELSALRAELDQARQKLNNQQYVIAMLAPVCLHCGRCKADAASCPAGFPGCGLADDLSLETPETAKMVNQWLSLAETQRQGGTLPDKG